MRTHLDILFYKLDLSLNISQHAVLYGVVGRGLTGIYAIWNFRNAMNAMGPPIIVNPFVSFDCLGLAVHRCRHLLDNSLTWGVRFAAPPGGHVFGYK
jgi:hypothetical protein